MVTREDISFFIENEIGGMVAANYAIMETPKGFVVRCGSFKTDILTDSNFSDAIHSLVTDVEYNNVEYKSYISLI